MGLKLYVWEGILRDWSCGIAFALANSPEEAAQKVRESGLEGYEGKSGAGPMIDGVLPKVYDSPIGFYLWGGS